MIRVKILGAGSIGNHLAHACREHDWAVTVCDIDPAALARTREEIYPSRYGAWDGNVRLCAPDAVADETFDIIIIGTPPDTHVTLAVNELERTSSLASAPAAAKLLVIEKPLCPPDLGGCDRLRERAAAAGTRVLVGYNHRLTRHTELAASWLAEDRLGRIATLRVLFREHWGGIFAAHPWLSGPAESYLGFTQRGGGALGEHSHGINIFQHVARLAGQGRITSVSAMLDEVRADGAAYDRIAQLSVRTESGMLGTIVQDVVTRPAQKWLRLEGEAGYLEWQVNWDAGHDLVRLALHDGDGREARVPKTRPDDFRGEVAHLAELIAEPLRSSPLSLDEGLDTMRVIAAALKSARECRVVDVDYHNAARAS
jgi:predicted dehydrogenase